jgi:Zn-dependent protease
MNGLQFRVTGIPVRIEPVFLVTMGFLGFAGGRDTASLIVEWMAVAGVAVLVHELGHAVAFRSFGAHPRITLYGMGGVTVGEAQPPNRSLVVSVAGPGAGFLLGFAAVALERVVDPTSTVVRAGFSDLIWVSFAWGVLNLLPILPLDGGNVSRNLLDRVTDGAGERPARVLSIVAAVALGVLGAVLGQVFVPFLAVFFVMQNYQVLRALRDGPQAQRLDSARGALLRGDDAQALELVESVAAAPSSWPIEVTAAELLAWVHLAQGDVSAAQADLARLRAGVSGTTVLVRACADYAAARPAQLAHAFSVCDDLVGATVAARLVVASGGLDQLLDDIAALSASAGPDALRALQLGLHKGGRFRESARVGGVLFDRQPVALVAYNVACSWACAGETEEALAWLNRAVDTGFRDTGLLDSDANFDSVRESDGFRALRSWIEASPADDDPGTGGSTAMPA